MRQLVASFGRAVDGDVALDLGAGVEVLDVDAADLLGDVAAEQAAERIADRTCCFSGQRAGDVERARQRRRQRQHIPRAGSRDRPARGGPADIGVLQYLRDGIVGLAVEGFRRAAIGGVADRRQRNDNRRHHNGAARRWRQWRQFDKHQRPDRVARRQPVHRLQADQKRDRDDRNPDQNPLEMHRQTHRPPGLNMPRIILQGWRRGRQSGRAVSGAFVNVCGRHARLPGLNSPRIRRCLRKFARAAANL